MEKEIQCNGWQEVEEAVRSIEASRKRPEPQRLLSHSHLLFRGQGNSAWQLETTLDRARTQSTAFIDYYKKAAIAKTQIETFTAREWAEISLPSLLKFFSNYDNLHVEPIPHYDYLIYLRHHGFPSPLLDWTRSLYIAAFFAFQKPTGDRVSIFVYREYEGGGKLGSSTEPSIFSLGPNVRSHPRHFLQQGEYTLCAQFLGDEWHFAKHSDVFQLGREGQDQLWKLTVPTSESKSVLKNLEQYNINSFSLFQSEESLLETLARKLI